MNQENTVDKNSPISAETIRLNILNGITRDKERLRVARIVIDTLETYHNRKITRALQTKLTELLDRYVVSYQAEKGDYGYTYLRVYHYVQGSGQQEIVSMTLATRPAGRDSFDFAEFMKATGNGYLRIGDHIMQAEAFLRDTDIEQEVEQYNTALESLTNAKAVFTSFAYYIWR